MRFLRKILRFIKERIKFILKLFVLVLVLAVAGLYFYQNYQEKQILEKRLIRLEVMNDSLKLSPETHFRNAKNLLRKGKFYDALKTLQSITAKYPNWKPALVLRAKDLTERTIKSLENHISYLEENITGYEANIEEGIIAGALPGDPGMNRDTAKTKIVEENQQVAFQKFEYEDRKVYPYQASTQSHAPKQYSAKTTQTEVKAQGEQNYMVNFLGDTTKDKSFKKFEFEDPRYKKNVKPSIKAAPTTKKPKSLFAK